MTFLEIRKQLEESAEEGFREFNAKVIPTSYPMLGVRTPTVKRLAKAAGKDYLENTPKYYEEVIVYGFVLGRVCASAEELFAQLPRYLSFVDNWAAIDSPLSGMKAFKKDSAACYERLPAYLSDEREYFARFGCVALFDYLNEAHIDEVLALYKTVPSGRYYVDMAVAWGLSIAAVNFYDQVLEALARGDFSKFVTRKAVGKCRDSFRIPPERKAELKALLTK